MSQLSSWNAKGVHAEIARGRAHPPRKRRRGSQPRVSDEGNSDSPNNRSIFYHRRAMRLLKCAWLGIAGSLQLTGCYLSED